MLILFCLGYMDGEWDCDKLDEFCYRIFINELHKDTIHFVNRCLNYMLLQVFNLQTPARAFEVGVKHYDQGSFNFILVVIYLIIVVMLTL